MLPFGPTQTILILLIIAVILIPLVMIGLAGAKWVKKTMTGSDDPLMNNRGSEPPASPYRDREPL